MVSPITCVKLLNFCHKYKQGTYLIISLTTYPLNTTVSVYLNKNVVFEGERPTVHVFLYDSRVCLESWLFISEITSSLLDVPLETGLLIVIEQWNAGSTLHRLNSFPFCNFSIQMEPCFTDWLINTQILARDRSRLEAGVMIHWPPFCRDLFQHCDILVRHKMFVLGLLAKENSTTLWASSTSSTRWANRAFS